ncbi:MAG: hypothetical protein KatS3mg076_0310 [Candidatus Binatia bacterium]|nr:MAG: hypothetical protein KatS3mg076_0310 [Candidatus Binatia bacterium]
MKPPLLDAVRTYLLDVDRPESEVAAYRTWVEGNAWRFARTLELVPDARPGERCLEAGAAPYTLTLLLRKFRGYEVVPVDFFAGPDGRERRETLVLSRRGERHEVRSLLFDLERETLPLADESVQGVLFTEILEHFTSDPTAALGEVHRVLAPGGWLVLTTPNVAHVANLLHLAHGRNVYRPYELVFGPTWRHNREYTFEEVAELLRGCGFEIERAYAENPWERIPRIHRLLETILRFAYRKQYGYQMYFRARKVGEFRWYYPAWLYEHRDLYMAPKRPYIRVGINDEVQLGPGWDEVARTTQGRRARHLERPGLACLLARPGVTKLALELFAEEGPVVLEVASTTFPPEKGSFERRERFRVDPGSWRTLLYEPARASEAPLALELRPSGPVHLAEIRWVD